MAYGFIIDFFLSLVQPLFPYTFDPVFGSLLAVGSPLTGARLTIVLVSVVLSALVSVLYYILMDVEKYQEIKEKREELNEKMQAARDEENMEEANEYMKEMAGMQKEFFSVMLKPMFASMFIFFLLLPWLFSTFTPVIALSAGATNATYTGTLGFNGQQIPIEVDASGNETAVVVEDETYAVGDTFHMGDLPWKVKTIDTEAGTVKVAAEVVPLPLSLPFLGDELGWLGTYILVSIPLTFLFRRWLGIQ